MQTYNFGVKSAAWAASLAARGFRVVERGGGTRCAFAVSVPGQTRRQAKRRFNALFWEAFTVVHLADNRSVYQMRPKSGTLPREGCSGENPLLGTELREERSACYAAGHEEGICGECSGDGWTYRTRRIVTSPCTEDFFLKRLVAGGYLRSPHV